MAKASLPSAKTIEHLARSFSEKTLVVLDTIVRDETAPAHARVAAAKVLLDRGSPKPRQASEKDLGFSQMTDAELEQEIARLASDGGRAGKSAPAADGTGGAAASKGSGKPAGVVH